MGLMLKAGVPLDRLRSYGFAPYRTGAGRYGNRIVLSEWRPMDWWYGSINSIETAGEPHVLASVNSETRELWFYGSGDVGPEELGEMASLVYRLVHDDLVMPIPVGC